VGEKKEDDIVGRLEALRKKVPPPKTDKSASEKQKAPSGEPDANRRRLARIIGVVVILAVLGGLYLVGSKFIIQPSETLPPIETISPTPSAISDVEQQAKIAELLKAKNDKKAEIEQLFTGLSSEYTSNKNPILDEITTAATTEAVSSITGETEATTSWRNYRKDEVDRKSALTGGAIAQIDVTLIKGAEEIKSQIDLLTLAELRTIVITELRSEFIPIRLPRDQVTGGFAEVGDRVNIHYRYLDQEGTPNETAMIRYLAKDGRVVAIMKPTSSIALSESEQQRQTGSGTEGKGNVTSITMGQYGLTISDGPYGASVGVKSLEKSSSYTVDLGEVQKAAAASKVELDDFMANMEKYGVRLSEIERETNMGDLDTEYLMLVEVSENEASEIALRLLDKDEKANLLVTISKAPSWDS
ncbi:MAG: DUF515 domain-containing protein, partial [Candidatus Hydrothermarchaeales archaeon]